VVWFRKEEGGVNLNAIQIAYLIMGMTMFVTLLIVVLIIAGRDMKLAFKRRFMPRGADILLVNLNRNVSHLYLVPKDGMFRIKGLPYVANPQKVLNVTEEDLKRIDKADKAKQERIDNQVQLYESQKAQLKEMIETAKTDAQKFHLQSLVEHIDKRITDLKNTSPLKEENYFKYRRAFYLYLEGDPLPKNLHEFQTITDSQILDNIIARIKTAAPESLVQNDVKKIKLLLIIVLGVAVIAAYFAWRDQQMLELLLKNAGLNPPALLGGLTGG
jgi:uncharacterized membrane protein